MEICADCGKEKQYKDKAYTKLKAGGTVCEECANIRRAARDKNTPANIRRAAWAKKELEKEPVNELLKEVKSINAKLGYFMFLVVLGIILSLLGSCLGGY